MTGPELEAGPEQAPVVRGAAMVVVPAVPEIAAKGLVTDG
jgi:hypothetical protein